MSDFIYVVCEGQSEMTFVKQILSPYIQERSNYQCFLNPFVVITSFDRRKGRVFRGGLTDYQKPKNDILRCLKSGRPVTTMFDYFGLPTDFPNYEDMNALHDDYEKVRFLEKQMQDDIGNDLFFPYISLHEFEALFYCDLDTLKLLYTGYENEIEKLKSEIEGRPPESINDGENTSPSKRLLNHLKYEKGSEIMIPLNHIGIDKMREKCPHFSEWVSRIEAVV